MNRLLVVFFLFTKLIPQSEGLNERIKKEKNGKKKNFIIKRRENQKILYCKNQNKWICFDISNATGKYIRLELFLFIVPPMQKLEEKFQIIVRPDVEMATFFYSKMALQAFLTCCYSDFNKMDQNFCFGYLETCVENC